MHLCMYMCVCVCLCVKDVSLCISSFKSPHQNICHSLSFFAIFPSADESQSESSHYRSLKPSIQPTIYAYHLPLCLKIIYLKLRPYKYTAFYIDPYIQIFVLIYIIIGLYYWIFILRTLHWHFKKKTHAHLYIYQYPIS